MDSMIPLLTGWLVGSLVRDGKTCMKIVSVVPDAPDGVIVEFAGGLRLQVRIWEIKLNLERRVNDARRAFLQGKE